MCHVFDFSPRFCDCRNIIFISNNELKAFNESYFMRQSRVKIGYSHIYVCTRIVELFNFIRINNVS